MRAKLIITCLLACLCWVARAQTYQLKRKAFVGIMATPDNKQLRVDSVLPGSSMQEAGIIKGDRLVTWNGIYIHAPEDYTMLATRLREGDEVKLVLLRQGEELKKTMRAVPRPFEASEQADITYDWVAYKGGWLRAITKRPKGKSNTAAILFIPGYNCGSIETFPRDYNGRIISEWLQAGYTIVEIEKSGNGDSYDCKPCAEADLQTDIETYSKGYEYMQKLPFVDKNNLFIWGHSMGGVIAPELGKIYHPKGIMVFGTVFRPWSEFLLEMHRVQKPLLDSLDYQQTEAFVRTIQKIYYEFFVLKKTPRELYCNPEYKALVVSELEYKAGSNNMWGRHWRFWQQLDSLNLAESWKLANCPVLVLNGGADYEKCAPIEPVLIEQTVNAAHPGYATRIQVDDLDHFMMTSRNYKEAVENFRNRGFAKGNFNGRIAAETITWLDRVSGKK